MRRGLFIMLLMFTAGWLSGCSDSDGKGEINPFFQVVIEVEDPDGNPVPGLNVELTSDNPYLQDFRNNKAVTRIEFRVPRQAQARLTVEDINGTPIRDLVDGVLAAGRHQIAWDARNYAGVHQPSGRYTVRMIGYSPETGLPEFEETVDILMCLVDPFQAPIGVTDKRGRLVISEKSHFPHLYDRDPMTATNENSEIHGFLEPNEDMIVSLGDTTGGGMMIFREKIPGRGIYRFEWTRQVSRRRERTIKAAGLDDPVPMPPAEWMLGPAYPNPFN